MREEMDEKFYARLRASDLTGDVLTEIFSHLEAILRESKTQQLALTMGYVTSDDQLQEGELIPTINVVLTQYHKEPTSD
jgi:hypothetical protein